MSAIPFITQNHDNGYMIQQESTKFFKSIKSNFGIITIVGKYRTGKSYLINKLLGNANVFSVGSTVNACTKGIWVQDRVVEFEGKPCVLMDCEGLGGVDENKNHDTKLFTLAALLSSFLVYNCKGAIDENSLQNLSLVLDLAKNFKVQEFRDIGGAHEVSKAMPKLLWVVRDFSLRLEDSQGRVINSDQQLENALTEVKGVSENIQSKNRIRKVIRDFFHERGCVCLVRPTDEESSLQNLLHIPDRDLRPEFVQGLASIKATIASLVNVKALNDHVLDGEQFITVASSYLNSINSGGIPTLQTAWSYMCINHNNKVIQDLENTFKKYIETDVQPQMPFTSEELNVKLKNMINQLLAEQDKQRITGHNEDFRPKLMEDFKKITNNTIDKNLKQSVEVNSTQLEKYRLVIKNFITKGEIDTISKLTAKIEDIQKEYLIKVSDNDEKMQSFTKWKDSMLAKYGSQIFEIEKSNLKKSTSLLNNQLEALSHQLKNKEEEIDTDRKKIENQMYQATSERDLALKESKVLKEKLTGLLQQKQEFETKQLLQIQSYENKYINDIKDLQKTLEHSKNQIQQIEKESDEKQKIYKTENQKLLLDLEKNQTVIDKLKQQKNKLESENQNISEDNTFLNRKIEDIKTKQEDRLLSSQKEISDLKEKLIKLAEYKKDKTQLNNQILIQKENIETQKLDNQALRDAISKNSPHENKFNDLVNAHAKMANTLNSMESRCQNLENKLKETNVQQTLFKHAMSIQCNICKKQVIPQQFEKHINACNKDANQYIRNSSYEFTVKDAKLVNSNNHSTVQYQINIKHNRNEQQIIRNHEDIQRLHQTMEEYFNHQIPLENEYIRAFNHIELSDFSQKVIAKNISQLEFYLNGCAANEDITDTEVFLMFIRADRKISGEANHTSTHKSAHNTAHKSAHKSVDLQPNPRQFLTFNNESENELMLKQAKSQELDVNPISQEYNDPNTNTMYHKHKKNKVLSMSLSSDQGLKLSDFEGREMERIPIQNLEKRQSNGEEHKSPKREPLKFTHSLNPNLKQKKDEESKENNTVKNILRNSFSKMTQQRQEVRVASPKPKVQSFLIMSPKSSNSTLNLTSASQLNNKLNDSKTKSGNGRSGKFDSKKQQSQRHLLRQVENRIIDKND